MADSSPAPETPPSTESKAQREARLRRERRNAKLQAGGSERLSKITSMSGRPAAAEAELNRSSPQRNQSPSGQQNDSVKSNKPHASDPAEVDISNMFQAPAQGSDFENQQEMFRRMLRANEDTSRGHEAAPGGGVDPSQEDPMLRMMQMLGNMGGRDGQGGGAPDASDAGLPPGLASLLGNASGEQEQAPPSSGDYLWRIVHALFSFLLALYAVTSLSFTGSSLSRSEYITDPIGPRLFWMFATAEIVLQSTRYFVDRGKLPPGSVMGKIAAFLPEPYAGYVRVLNRYSIIYTTVVSDAFVVVFVLGSVSWWRGLANA